MRKNLVKYQDDEYNVEIEVGQATIQMGLARSDLWFDARSSNVAGRSLLSRIGILQTYPACVAATLSVNNLPKLNEEGEPELTEAGGYLLYPKQLSMADLTLEAYLALPESLGVLWQDAVFNLNPHWLPKLPEEEGAEGEVEEPSKETS